MSQGNAAIGPWSARTIRDFAGWWSLGGVLSFLVLLVVRGIPRSPDLGPAEAPLQLGLLAVLAAASIGARRHPGWGGSVLVAGSIGLGMFAAVEYHPLVALFSCLVFLVPGLAYLTLWQMHRPVGAVIALGLALAIALFAGWLGASRFYATYFGATHPDSVTSLERSRLVEWLWSGGVSPEEITVVARLEDAGAVARLLVSDAGGEIVAEPEAVAGEDRMVRFTAAGLQPDTRYSYRIKVDGSTNELRDGEFRTLPADAGSFTVAFGSCARAGSTGAVFDAIHAVDPILYLITGDAYYGDIPDADPAAFSAAFDQMLGSPAQQGLYLAVPVAYVWDDHDYGANDGDGTSPTRDVARASYRQFVPHYALPSPGPIYQAFSIGRVRFILTDGRSERSPKSEPDGPGKSMLGAEQLAWLEAELLAAADGHGLVVWVNPVPWVTAERTGADDWGGYDAERSRIADFIASHGIAEHLLMVSGDAHMVAIDDGSHSDFSAAGGGGFPVLHAAALDRVGSLKGGPYSEGAFPGGGQFGVVRVTDDGGSVIGVELAGLDWTGAEIVSYRFSVSASWRDTDGTP